MIDRQNMQRAKHFFTGAPAAQTAAKPLKSFVPLAKSCGAKQALAGCVWHKKTPRNRAGLEGCALLKPEFLRNLPCTGALVNTPTAVRLK
jgi:hypothetical protein